MQGGSFLFRFRKLQVNGSVLVKKFQVRITGFNDNAPVFNDAMPDPPVVKEKEVAVIFGFVSRVKIIVMADGLTVSLLVLYLFVGQDRPVIESKIPTRR